MDAENGFSASSQSSSYSLRKYRTSLLLAYQSLGVVYGDLSISPIYVFKSTFSGNLRLHEEDAEIFGVFSLIFWTLTLIPLVKYILFVLQANDHGEGGILALYSLLCRRHSNMGLLHGFHHDKTSSSPASGLPMKKLFEKHQACRIFLLLMVLLGTGMVIGDGVLTPAMSVSGVYIDLYNVPVLSAVSGIRVKAPQLHESYTLFLACFIITGLFGLQHFGTHRVGFLFAPILIMWLLCVSGIGIYNTIKWNPSVVSALSPVYVFRFFKKRGVDAWRSLGGVVLCITGTEAMFADLGHFSKISMRIAFIGAVYPCLIVGYMGEAAYLSTHKDDILRGFHTAIPENIFWPVFVIGTMATVVGSQAVISATFSIISQCRALSCFPRVKIIHTSYEIHGQIYIPEVNWILMLLCIAVTIGFRDTHIIGNAYGLAVITVMLITTCLMFLVITLFWDMKIIIALAFTLLFGSFEMLYFSACVVKMHLGGWLPLLFSVFIMIVMSVWHYGTSRKQAFQVENKLASLDRLLEMSPGLGLIRIPGIGLVYSNVPTGVPPMFAHFVTNFPAFHRILIFVSVRSLSIPKVGTADRFNINRIGAPEYRLYQCVVSYGYKDQRRNSYDFENQLVFKLTEFLQRQPGIQQEEVEEVMEAKDSGVVYMMGHTYVKALRSSSLPKKLAINAVYGFLRQNCRHPAVSLGVPHANLIEVGMVYHV